MTVAPPPDGADKAARQLESFFLRQLLAEARPQGGGGLDGGFAGDTFKSMLDEAIADKMADAGGIGLAKMFARELEDGPAPVAHAIPPSTVDLPSRTEAPSGFVMPVAGRASSAYGMRMHPIKHVEQLHPGLDLAAPTGTPVVAASPGTVTHAGPAGTYGNLVTIKHANGVETRYAHLSEVTVARGARVGAGDSIGKVGSTGQSTGPHLHFEVRQDGKLQDPEPLLPLKRSPTRASR